MRERQVGRLQRERFVHGHDGRTMERGDGFHRTLLAEVSTNHLVDLVDLDGGHKERITTLDVGGEAIRVRAVGQVLDPTARIDQDQRRSFFSRSPLGLAPRAMPRYARIGRSGTRKITPPLSRTVIRIPGRRRRRSRAPRGRTSWYLLDSVTVSIVLRRGYRWPISKSRLLRRLALGEARGQERPLARAVGERERAAGLGGRPPPAA